MASVGKCMKEVIRRHGVEPQPLENFTLVQQSDGTIAITHWNVPGLMSEDALAQAMALSDSGWSPVPESISMRQLRLKLLEQDLLTAAETALVELPEPLRSKAKIEWEYATDIERSNPILDQLSKLMLLTSEQVDTMFREAAQL